MTSVRLGRSASQLASMSRSDTANLKTQNPVIFILQSNFREGQLTTLVTENLRWSEPGVPHPDGIDCCDESVSLSC